MPGGGKGVIAESFDVHTVGASSRTDINHANSLCHNSAARRGFAHSCRLYRRTHTDASSAVPFKVTAWVGLRGYASFTRTRRAPIASRTVKSASGGSSDIVDEEWVWKSGCERNCPRLVLWRDCCVEWCLADTQLHRPRTWNCASPRHVDTSFRST